MSSLSPSSSSSLDFGQLLQWGASTLTKPDPSATAKDQLKSKGLQQSAAIEAVAFGTAKVAFERTMTAIALDDTLNKVTETPCQGYAIGGDLEYLLCTENAIIRETSIDQERRISKGQKNKQRRCRICSPRHDQ